MADLGCVEAERALLSSVWLDGDASMLARLEEKDFVDKFNRWLVSSLKAIDAAGEPLDAVALVRRIRSDKKAPDDAQIEAMQLLSENPTARHKEYYFRTIRKERGRRYFHQICDEAKKRDLRHPNEPLETFVWMQQHIAAAIAALESISA